MLHIVLQEWIGISSIDLPLHDSLLVLSLGQLSSMILPNVWLRWKTDTTVLPSNTIWAKKQSPDKNDISVAILNVGQETDINVANPPKNRLQKFPRLLLLLSESRTQLIG